MNYNAKTNYTNQDEKSLNDTWHYSPLEVDKLSEVVSKAAKNIYSSLTPGLPKCVYQLKLFNHLVKKGFHLEIEKSMLNQCAENEPVRELIIVNKILMVECIAENEVIDHFQKRIIFDLENTNNEVGLLINFAARMQQIEITKVARKSGAQLGKGSSACNQ